MVEQQAQGARGPSPRGVAQRLSGYHREFRSLGNSTMIRLLAMLDLVLQLFLSTSVSAHEMRPAYLEMKETAPDVFAVVWKVPALGELRLGLYVSLPVNCKPKAE